mmetsp:Transcript_34717/g.25862  ORF Transcript_34717/g.25862 Transcript_34717/m.25862 type:complete len:117 (-) Transcript_34717:1347-1697(-)
MKFHEESVLDSFVFMCQDFSQHIFKTFVFEFLEIEFLIFSGFNPDQVFNWEEHQAKAFKEIEHKAKEEDKHRELVRTMRHSKFGTLFGRRRADGSMAMVRNLYVPPPDDFDSIKQR